MSEAYLFGTGGVDNLKSAFANINVKYPAGSTLVCTNAETGKTYKASNTLGSYTFGVNSAGTWDITATRGEDTKTDHVEITEQGQNVSIEIFYILYVYKEGEQIEGGFKTRTSASDGRVTFNPTYISLYHGWSQSVTLYTANPIDLSKYKTLTVRHSGTTLNFGLGAGTSSTISLGSKSAGTNQIDISSQNSVMNLFFWVSTTGQSTGTANIFEIYLV